MPGSMDERVVSMQFDNRKFEKNARTSMKTLDDLKESLDFDGVGKSMDAVEKKFQEFGKKNPFPDVNSTVEKLQIGMYRLGDSTTSMIGKFAEITKITAMIKMAESAIHSLQRQIKRFTIEPISQGFDKYTTKIGSIKTISNATGMAADAVNDSLDRLNWFTDETSASFSEMVANIGKFTSVGRQLDESITAMEGIATWGYHSGASVTEINRAMYNLSQALGTGSVKLIDWKSIENAGMATKEFKEQAIAAAEAAGTLKRKGDKLFTQKGNKEVNYSNFNETLSQGWFTSDVLMSVLGDYGGFADEVRRYQEEHPQYGMAAEAMAAMDAEREAKHDELMKQLEALVQGDTQLDKDVKDVATGRGDETGFLFSDEIESALAKLAKGSKASVDEIRNEWFDYIKLVDTDYEASLEKLKELQKKYGEETIKDLQTLSSTTGLKKSSKSAGPTTTMTPIEELAKASKMSAKELERNIERINKIADTKERAKEISELAKTLGIDSKKLTEILDELAKTEESLGEKAFKSSQQSKSLNDSIDATLDAVSTQWMNSFQTIFGGLDDSIELWSDVTEILWDLFASGGDARNNALTHWAEEFAGRDDLWGEDGILHSIMDTIIELKELLGTSFKNVFFSDLSTILGQTNMDEGRNITNGLYTIDQLRQRKEGSYMGKQLKNITQSVKEFTQSIREFFTNDQNFAKIGQIFKSVATVVQFFGSVIGSVFKMFSNFATNTGIFQDILNIITKVADKIREITEKIQKSGFFDTVFGKIGDTLAWMYNTLKKWYGQISKFFEETGLADQIRGFFQRISDYFLGGADDVDENGNKTESAFFRSFGWVGKVKEWVDKIDLNDILHNVHTFVTNFGEIWSAFGVALTGEKLDKKALADSGMDSGLQDIITSVWDFGNKLSGVVGFIVGLYNQIVGWLESSGILPKIREIWDNVKTFFENIGLIWDTYVNGKAVDPSKLNAKQLNLLATVNQFISRVKNLFNKLKGWFSDAWAWIQEKWGLLVGWLESSGILPKIRSAWDKIKTVVANFSQIWSAFKVALTGEKLDKKALADSGMDGGLQDIIAKVWDFGNRVHDAIENVKGIWDRIKNWLETSGILPTLRDWWSKITGWFDGISKDVSENGIFSAVSNFFTDLWEKITGLFGGGEGAPDISSPISADNLEKPLEQIGDGGIFGRIRKMFTNDDGSLNISKGFSESLSSGVSWIVETLAGIDWKQFGDLVGNVIVDTINGIDDAFGRLHIDNILAVISKVIGAFTGVMIFKSIDGIIQTVAGFATKKKKSLLEKLTDLINSIGQALLQIGISVALIAASIWLLSTIKSEDLDRAMKVFVAIGVFFAAVIVVAAVFQKKKGFANTLKAMGVTFLNIGIAVALIVASIAILAVIINQVGIKSVILATVGVALIMGAMLLVVKALAKITKGNAVNISVGIATFAGLAIVIATLTVCLILMQGLDLGRAIIDLGLLVGAIFGIMGAMKLLDKVKISAKTFATMIVVAGIIVILTGAFYLLKDVDPVTIGVIAVALVGTIAGLAAAMLIVAKIPVGAIKGAAILAAALVILIAGLAVGGIIMTAALENMMNAIVSIMSSLTAASISAENINKEALKDAIALIPELVAGIVDSQIDPNVLNNVMTTVHNVWDLMELLKLASIAAQNVKVSAFETIFGTDGTTGVFAAIKTAISGITDTGETAVALGGNLERLGNSLQLLGVSGLSLTKMQVDADGNALGTYSEGIEAMKTRLEDIRSIVSMAGELGTGENGEKIDLTTFSEGIANIGAALQLYNTAVSKILEEKAGIEGTEIGPLDTEQIRSALQQVMGSLTEMTLDESDKSAIYGWASLETGDGGQTKFALGLINIANAMTEFSKSAEGFNNDNVTNAISALGTLAEIKKEVETPSDYNATIDGITGWKPGDKDTEGTFANSIVGMGNAMVAFGDSVKSIDKSAVNNATIALRTMTTIYTKLKGNEGAIKYFAKIGDNELFSFTTETSGKSSKEIFHEFGLGISELGTALVAFGDSVSKTTDGHVYDSKKVEQAVDIIEALSDMQIALRDSTMGKAWWDMDDNLKNFGNNLSGLGSRLTAFSKELKDFDLNTKDVKWTDISTVLSYLAGLEVELSSIYGTAIEYYENGKIAKQYTMGSFSLESFSGGISQIIDQVIKFNAAMHDIYTEADGKGTYQLGDWNKDNFNNIKGMLDYFKQVAIDIKSNNLTNSDINAIGELGGKIGELFRSLTFNEAGEFLAKLDNLGSFSDLLNTLAGSSEEEWNAKGLGLAGSLISGFSSRLTTDDEKAGKTMSSVFTSLLGKIDEYSTDFEAKGQTAGEKYAFGFRGRNDGDVTILNDVFTDLLTSVAGFESQFFDKGKLAGQKYVEGFKNEQGWALINRHSEFEESIKSSFTNIFSVLDGYSTDYYNKGKTAGERYAAGFEQGMKDAGFSTLTPIVSMDNNGNVAGGETGVVAYLAAVGYATSKDVESISTRLDMINRRFDTPINVNDSHADVTAAIAVTNSNLSLINANVGRLRTEVNNLKVYINSKILVGAIAGDMDRELGRRGNLISVS